MMGSTKDSLKISHQLCELLDKEVKFKFNDACMDAFKSLKEKLVSPPIIISPNWSELLEVICDSSGMPLGVVLGERETNYFTQSIKQARL